jgi:putative redox protein
MSIKLQTHWSQGMQFESCTRQSLTVSMDAKAPIGHDKAMTPKELVVAGIAGCTGIDVMAFMKKHKQKVESFVIHSEVDQTLSGHPVVFTKVKLVFEMKGDVVEELLKESVLLSQTKYCGVSAMIAKGCPIEYTIRLNDRVIVESAFSQFLT